MFQRAISLDDFAGIFPAMTVLGRVDAGMIATTTGTHPQLGAVVVIEDMAPGLILHSEHPADQRLFAASAEPAERLCGVVG